jgi:Sigma-70 factor, region 1.2
MRGLQIGSYVVSDNSGSTRRGPAVTTTAASTHDAITERDTSSAGDSMMRYLDEIGRSPRLSRVDEVRLGRLVGSGDQTATT